VNAKLTLSFRMLKGLAETSHYGVECLAHRPYLAFHSAFISPAVRFIAATPIGVKSAFAFLLSVASINV
jgi:hypothetical protein